MVRICIHFYSTLFLSDVYVFAFLQSYFQIGQDQGKNTIRLRCLVDLFEDIIAEPFFNQLRWAMLSTTPTENSIINKIWIGTYKYNLWHDVSGLFRIV